MKMITPKGRGDLQEDLGDIQEKQILIFRHDKNKRKKMPLRVTVAERKNTSPLLEI